MKSIGASCSLLLIASLASPVPAGDGDVQAWIKALESGDAARCHEAAEAIRKLGEAGAPAAPALIRAFAKADRRRLKTATIQKALVSIGPGAVAPLLAGLKGAAQGTEGRSLRANILDTLGQLGPRAKAAAPYLAERIERRRGFSFMVEWMRTLGAISSAPPPSLVKTLRSRSKALRIGAACALANSELEGLSSKDRAGLARALTRDKCRVVRERCAVALGRAGAGDASRALAKGLKDAEVQVRLASAHALNALKAESAAVIKAMAEIVKGRAADTDDALIKSRAIERIGDLGEAASSAVGVLIAAGLSDHWLVAGAASEALPRLGPKVVPALGSLLATPDETHARFAANQLGRLGKDARGALPALIKATREAPMLVQVAAIEALGDIGVASEEVLAALKETAADQSFRNMSNAAAAKRSLKKLAGK